MLLLANETKILLCANGRRFCLNKGLKPPVWMSQTIFSRALPRLLWVVCWQFWIFLFSSLIFHHFSEAQLVVISRPCRWQVKLAIREICLPYCAFITLRGSPQVNTRFAACYGWMPISWQVIVERPSRHIWRWAPNSSSRVNLVEIKRTQHCGWKLM